MKATAISPVFVELRRGRHHAPDGQLEARAAVERLLDDVGEAVLLDALVVFAVLQHGAERGRHALLVELADTQPAERGRPVDGLGDARRLVEIEVAHGLDRSRDLPGEMLRAGRHSEPHDRHLAVETGVLDPVVEAAALERVVHVACAVRGEDHDRRRLGPVDAELGHRDLEVAEYLQQVSLELVVGTVDLVDQQHRRWTVTVADRPQQCPLDEESLLVQVGLDRIGRLAGGLTRGLGRAEVQELACVVPVVHRLRGVDALVALQPDQLAPGPRRQHLRQLGLADAGLAFEQQRALQLERGTRPW